MSFWGSDKKPKHQHPSENHYGIWQIDIKYLCWIINAFWVRFTFFFSILLYLFSLLCSLNFQRIKCWVLSRMVSKKVLKLLTLLPITQTEIGHFFAVKKIDKNEEKKLDTRLEFFYPLSTKGLTSLSFIYNFLQLLNVN